MKNDVQRWITRDPDPDTKKELEDLVAQGATGEIEQRFTGRLAFGTAGLRGVLGAGPNRMNRLVVRETTAGLGNYLREQVEEAQARGVVIGYDGRTLSREMAHDAATVLAALDFRVYLFDGVGPTPLCAFSVKNTNAAAGIMVTASHNPPEYNGYKVYWGNGAQIIPPHDTGIAAAIDEAAKKDVPWCDLDQAGQKGRVTFIDDAMRNTYLKGVRSLSPPAQHPTEEPLVIAYTALHGVGAALAERALGEAGFGHVHSVAEQREPDGRFPTVRFPNPEEPGAMDLVLALAKKQDADLACANDPDADRLAVAAKVPGRDYQMLTGDQVGALLGAEQMKRASGRCAVASTVVSSRLLGVMAQSKQIAYYETLTGLKWIADASMRAQEKGETFLFGYEEALGYMIGDLVRDKDGISALVAFAELAADCRRAGETVWDRLTAIYREHGLFLTQLQSIAFDPDRRGPPVGQMLRDRPPHTIADKKVSWTTDIAAGKRTEADGSTTPIDLPKSDVLVFGLDDHSRVIVRPSGTEPKLKCYYEVCLAMGANESLDGGISRARTALETLITEHQKEIHAL